MKHEPKHIQNHYYVSQDYNVLAGPYEMNSNSQKRMLNNVVNDMKRGSIDYRIVYEDFTKDGLPIKRAYVERRGMILSKGEKYD